MWEFLTDPQNRELLGWLGGGLTTIAVGTWAVFTYFHRRSGAGSQPSTISANRGVAAGRDVNARDITFSTPDKPSKRKR